MKKTMVIAGVLWVLMPALHPEQRGVAQLEKDRKQYDAIRKHAAEYGKGGQEVLKQAYQALREQHAAGKAPLVELADLWAESLQEGFVLFNKPEKLWGATLPGETLDMLGQTTVGPWQMTSTNIQLYLGPAYGVQKDWKLRQVVDFCRQHPMLQAKMASDLVEWNYESQGGKRAPYAIQSYFWLEAYVKGDIGKGAWDDPVLVLPDAAGKVDNSAERRRMTGFYGKQLLLGWKDQPKGILYWLWVAGDQEGIQGALRAWREQKPLAWDATQNKPVKTLDGQPGFFEIKSSDLKYGGAAFTAAIRQLLENESKVALK